MRALDAIDLTDPGVTGLKIREALGLAAHPEGGWYRETFRDAPADGGRGAATAILFLLQDGEESALHRVDAVEIWLFHAGAPLELRVGEAVMRLGLDASRGEALQGVVPAFAWQAARSTGAWTLVSCIVAPAFRFEGFELKGIA